MKQAGYAKSVQGNPATQDSAGRGSLPLCSVCEEPLTKKNRLLLLTDPEGLPFFDVREKLPAEEGRFVHLVEGCLPKNLSASVWKGAVEQCRSAMLSLIGLAQKQGVLVCGFAKIIAKGERQDIPLMFHASDASPSQKKKLAPKGRKSPNLAYSVLEIFSCEQLSRATGRENVRHAALLQPKLAEKIMGYGEKLATIEQWVE